MSRVHVLVVMGEGGHTKQCLRLIELMGTDHYRYSYVVVAEDQVTPSKLTVEGPIYRVTRPGSIKTSIFRRFVGLPACIVQSAIAVLASRPDAVLSTGPGVALPVAAFARLLGARVIFVESFSRVRRLSMTGRLMRPLAHLYFVQWEDLRTMAPGAFYAGRLY